MSVFYLSRNERTSFFTLFILLVGISCLSSAFETKDEDLIDTPILLNLEMNRATLMEWNQMPGINSYLSERIIKYKNYLGGYHKKEQLLEVFGMDSSIYKGMQVYLIVDSVWHQFDLNEVDFKVLLGHPYFDYDLVKSIFNYKAQHKGYDSLPQLKEIHLVNDELYGKIAPYLAI